jgi:hypothetical protein
VKLLDMGISKSLDDDATLTLAGTMVGTPGFASPEQARGDADLDCRIDIFSLGATLYFLLTGKPPFEGENIMQVIYKVTNTAPEPVTSLNQQISPACAELVARMMARDREERPADWQALIAEIDAVAAPAPAPPPARSSMKTCLVVGVSVGIVVFFLLAGLAVVGGRKAKQRRHALAAAEGLKAQIEERISACDISGAADLAAARWDSLRPAAIEAAGMADFPVRLKRLLTLDAEAAASRALLDAGDIAGAESRLHRAGEALPADLRAIAETCHADLLAEVHDARLHAHLVARTRALFTALQQGDPAGALDFVARAELRERGAAAARLQFGIIGAMLKKSGLRTDELRIAAVDIAPDAQQARVDFELRINGTWEAAKSLRWRLEGDEWYLTLPARAQTETTEQRPAATMRDRFQRDGRGNMRRPGRRPRERE